MGPSPEDGVVDADQRCGRAQPVRLRRQRCPTQGPANPALTIMALASRLAGRLDSGAAMDDDPEARTGRTSVTRNRMPGYHEWVLTVVGYAPRVLALVVGRA